MAEEEGKTSAWEAVSHDDTCDTDRLRVPGGWLYRVREYRLEGEDAERDFSLVAMGVAFVPHAPEPEETADG